MTISLCPTSIAV